MADNIFDGLQIQINGETPEKIRKNYYSSRWSLDNFEYILQYFYSLGRHSKNPLLLDKLVTKEIRIEAERCVAKAPSTLDIPSADSISTKLNQLFKGTASYEGFVK